VRASCSSASLKHEQVLGLFGDERNRLDAEEPVPMIRTAPR